MRLLLTGGKGFLGSYVVEHALRTGARVVDVDALTYAADPERHAAQPRHRYEHLQLDVAALHVDHLRRLGPFDAALHLAAESHVDNSLGAPDTAIRTNVQGTMRFLECARWLDVPRVVLMSTDEVTGALSPTDPPTTERSPIRPSSPYSASKASAELLALAWHRSYDLPLMIARSTNAYGPGQHPEKLVPRAITFALSRQPMPLFANGADAVRDWIYAADVAAGLWAILTKGRAGEVYGLGARCERRNRDVLDAVGSLVPGATIQTIPDRPGHDLRYASDPSKVERELGWRSTMEWGAGMERTVAWYAKNELWWRAAVKRGGAWALGA